MNIHIDIESFSELDLKKVGGYKYARHPSTEIMLAAIAVDDNEIRLWDYNRGSLEGIKERLRGWRNSGAIFYAFNANFERTMLRDVWGVDIPVEQWRCTMIHAWYLAFSGGLGEVGKQMGLPEDKQKLDTGRKLIQKFCKPQPKNHKVRRHTIDTAPDEWAKFREYCIGDVVTERAMEMGTQDSPGLTAFPVPEHIWAEWCIDQKINDRGVPVDRALIDTAVELDSVAKTNLRARMNCATQLSNANSVQQLKPWLEQQGVELPNMQKDTLQALLPKLDGLVADVVNMRLSVSQTSTTKWAAFQRAIMDDNRVRGMFAFGAAQRTLRWAGRLVQLHNLKRGYKDADEQVEDIYLPGVEIYRDPLDLLSNTIRAAITAEPGRRFAVIDLSAIESRVLGWVSGCVEMNKVFAEGRDTYRAFGAHHLNKPEDEITSDERTFYKPPVLGCGYQLGADGLITYAEGYGVDLDLEESADLVDLFRSVYHEVPDLWYWLVGAFTQLLSAGGRHIVLEKYNLRIAWDQQFIRILLPSGRHLSYYQPELRMMEPPWSKKKRREALERGEIPPEKEMKPTVTYMGRNQYTTRWERIGTHGGKITENIIQAIARDVLMFHITLLHGDGAKIVGHVHDEVIIDVDEDLAGAACEHAETTMSINPEWAPGLLLGAEGFTTKRYRKG